MNAIPTAVWTGTFTLFGVDVRCSVLDNGQRVVHSEDVHRMFIAMADESRDYGPGDIEAFSRWQRGEEIPR